jgi:hypothetical protein
MKPVDPRPPDVSWFVQKKVAEHQPEYVTLPALIDTRPIGPDAEGRGAVVSVWEPGSWEIAELRRMMQAFDDRGEPIKFTLTLWTFGQPLQPINLVVGERSEAWNVREGEPQEL